eukprot:scaffold2214_cov139-Cylindrotheca_fusiformis.AAC.5
MTDLQEPATSTPEKSDSPLSAARDDDDNNDDASPNTMVNKAVANAMRQHQEQRKPQREEEKEEDADNDGDESASKRIKISDDRANDEHHSLSLLEHLWSKDNVNNPEKRRKAGERTQDILGRALNELMQDGIQAHREWAHTKQKLQMAEEDIAAKTREIERLRAMDEKNRESITNLLRTLDTSNEETKDNCQAKLLEARLRADLLHMTAKRDEIMEEHAQTEQRANLLDADLADTKAKLTRVQQEKMQVERDQQATMSLANALQGNNQSDVDYYKRKVSELNTHIQGLTAILTEKNRQIESLRREKERSMSQNRLASYRAGGDRKKKVSF